MSNELKLDFDKKFDRRGFFKRLHVLMKLFNFKIKINEEKKTRHGCHIRLWMSKKFENKDIVFFQLLLGSDWRREMFNYYRVLKNVKHWNVLFKRKYDSHMNLLSEEEQE